MTAPNPAEPSRAQPIIVKAMGRKYLFRAFLIFLVSLFGIDFWQRLAPSAFICGHDVIDNAQDAIKAAIEEHKTGIFSRDFPFRNATEEENVRKSASAYLYRGFSPIGRPDHWRVSFRITDSCGEEFQFLYAVARCKGRTKKGVSYTGSLQIGIKTDYGYETRKFRKC